MNGPIPEAEANIIRNPNRRRTLTIGSSRQSLGYQRKPNHFLTILKFSFMQRTNSVIVSRFRAALGSKNYVYAQQ